MKAIKSLVGLFVMQLYLLAFVQPTLTAKVFPNHGDWSYHQQQQQWQGPAYADYPQWFYDIDPQVRAQQILDVQAMHHQLHQHDGNTFPAYGHHPQQYYDSQQYYHPHHYYDSQAHLQQLLQGQKKEQELYQANQARKAQTESPKRAQQLMPPHIVEDIRGKMTTTPPSDNFQQLLQKIKNEYSTVLHDESSVRPVIGIIANTLKLNPFEFKNLWVTISRIIADSGTCSQYVDKYGTDEIEPLFFHFGDQYSPDVNVNDELKKFVDGERKFFIMVALDYLLVLRESQNRPHLYNDYREQIVTVEDDILEAAWKELDVIMDNHALNKELSRRVSLTDWVTIRNLPQKQIETYGRLWKFVENKKKLRHFAFF